MLASFKIAALVDVRHFPGSRKFPHFNKEVLGDELSRAGIRYEHIVSLGGRRKPHSDSQNSAWRHPAFRGYADYMETPEFHEGMDRLRAIGTECRTAFMCSEAVWWRCHRSMIADLLKSEGWTVSHIISADKSTEHPYTAPARVTHGKLTYRSGEA